MTRKSQYFTALVTVDKTYDRHARTWRLTLHVQSASGLPYAVRELRTQRKNARYVKPGVTYKAYGYYSRMDEGWCSLDWLEDFAGLMAIKKHCMKINREPRESERMSVED